MKRNKIIKHYKSFFGLEDTGLGEDDHLMIDWAESLVKDCNLHIVTNSALPELNKFAVSNFDTIAEMTKRITSGNVSHNANQIQGVAKRCSEFIRKHYW